MTEINAEMISYLRIIHMLPGLEHRRYPVSKTMIASLGNLTNQDLSELRVTDEGLRYLESLGLRVFGRKQNDTHELHLRDRLDSVSLILRTRVLGDQP